uniref:Uncharacterized protein n=1 Tax=Amphimedon queenslandica TaxID=400682 RepID=A0A1X7VPV9_AMPQE
MPTTPSEALFLLLNTGCIGLDMVFFLIRNMNCFV